MVLSAFVTMTLLASGCSDSDGDPAESAAGTDSVNARGLTDAVRRAGLACTDLTLEAGTQRRCFRSAGDVDSEVTFQFGTDQTVSAVKIKTAPSASVESGSVYDDLLAAVGSSLFEPDLAAVRKLPDAGGDVSPAADASWGSYQLQRESKSVQLTARRHGAEVMTLPNRELTTTTPGRFYTAMRKRGYTCYAEGKTCTKRPAAGFEVLAAATGDDRITGLTVLARADEPGGEGTPYRMLSTVGDDAVRSLAPSGADALRRWISQHADGQDRQAYVAGLIVAVQFGRAAPGGEEHAVSISRTGSTF